MAADVYTRQWVKSICQQQEKQEIWKPTLAFAAIAERHCIGSSFRKGRESR
jgi:hypothetical protein